MNDAMVMAMFNLVERLSKKKLDRQELAAYYAGINFVENYFKINNIMLEKQLRDLTDEEDSTANIARDIE